MKEVALRRGKAAPHIRRRSRYQTRLFAVIKLDFFRRDPSPQLRLTSGGKTVISI
jgi:hypothetical protein